MTPAGAAPRQISCLEGDRSLSRLSRVGELRAQSADSHLHGFAPFPLGDRFSFRQMLRFIRRTRRFQAGGDEVIRHFRAIEQRLGPLALGVCEQAVANGNVCSNFRESLRGCSISREAIEVGFAGPADVVWDTLAKLHPSLEAGRVLVFRRAIEKSCLDHRNGQYPTTSWARRRLHQTCGYRCRRRRGSFACQTVASHASLSAMELLTISETRKRAQNGNVAARVHVQVNAAAAKATREGKPYCELTLADASDRMTLRVWSDHPDYRACDSLQVSDFIELTGEFEQHQQFGLDAKRWTVRALTAPEVSELLQGPPELRAKHATDWAYIAERVAALADPRLRALCDAFIAEWGERFRRTAGARTYHHARRGGLVEHTAQMMRLAAQIAPIYPQLNLDLLIAGILFHDSGKLWENYLPETGFTMGFDERGELMGHISIGMELVNSLWRKLQHESWSHMTPASDDVRLHLLHLIAAHHGEMQMGSPVNPKTPEAMALHYIDNLDARLEMFFAGYAVAKPIAPRIFDRVRPLPGNLVKPLERFSPPATPSDRLL